jgi:eukaryotic-like serine/threonine-protein kinase
MGIPRGKHLGRYEIVSEVGRGAMGSVYKARDPKIDRFVAIKTVLLHQSVIHEQQEFRRRFFVEAKAAGRLLHPGIVAVFDVGEEPETNDPYIVMEYIEGHTLREVLANNDKKLPLGDALRITQELAEALDYAHALGVVHRDIKPANVLITKDGQAKISDFGIAQLDLTHMTLPGRVLGTPAYMSPEQLEGEQVDGRSDLFSLGAILYTALTGYRPFQGNSATTVCFKVANRDPLQPTSLAPELPHELDAVIGRALAKSPADRYQRGKEFAEDLRKLRERTPARKGTTLWFSPPAAGRTWLEEKNTDQAASLAAPALAAATKFSSAKLAPVTTLPSPLRVAPRGSSSVGSIFSSWQMQTALGVPLFAAAVVVSLFAWRELHLQKHAPRGVAESANRAGSGSIQNTVPNNVADSVQKQTSGVAGAPDSPTDARATKIDGDAISSTSDASPESKAPPANGKSLAAKGIRKPSGSAATKVDSVQASGAVPKHVASAGTLSSANKTAGKPGTAVKTSGVGKPNGTSNEDATQPAIVAVAAPVADSDVQIQIESRFTDALLKIWIDNNLTYSHPLHDHKKRLLLLGGGTKEAITLPLAAGQHALRIEVRSASEQYDETKTVDGEFLSGGERSISISFDKHSKEMRVMLASQ